MPPCICTLGAATCTILLIPMPPPPVASLILTVEAKVVGDNVDWACFVLAGALD